MLAIPLIIIFIIAILIGLKTDDEKRKKWY
jgi:ABC-type transport system involved in cytochrome bd biosynthesis fused ATPase/permease subunit